MESCISAFVAFIHSVNKNDAIFFPVSDDPSDQCSLACLLGLSSVEFSKYMATVGVSKFNKRFNKFHYMQQGFEAFIVNCGLASICSLTVAKYKGKGRQLFLQVGSFPDGVEQHIPTMDGQAVWFLHVSTGTWILLVLSSTSSSWLSCSKQQRAAANNNALKQTTQ